MEQEKGEPAPMYHYIVAAYPRPGAILTHLVLQYMKKLRRQGKKIDSELLTSFALDLLK